MSRQVGAMLLIVVSGAGAPGCNAETRTLPEIYVNSNVLVDWRGDGVESGNVLEIDGHWVKMRFEYVSESSDAAQLAGAVVEPWINFERLAYYRITTRR